MINDIILKDLDDEFINSDLSRFRSEWNHYKYKEFGVPRVSEIIACTSLNGSEGLVRWANSLGFKHQSAVKCRDRAAKIGTAVHHAIEEYIKTGYIPLPDLNTPSDVQEVIDNCLEGFGAFWDNYRFRDLIDYTKLEQTILTPYFGGTFDLLIHLKDGRNLLYDFKTTNHLKDSQYLQLAAYQFGLREYYNIKTAGAGILLIDKNKPLCEEYFLDYSIPDNLVFMNQCENTFLSILHTYYNLKQTDYLFNEYLAQRSAVT